MTTYWRKRGGFQYHGLGIWYWVPHEGEDAPTWLKMAYGLIAIQWLRLWEDYESKLMVGIL